MKRAISLLILICMLVGVLIGSFSVTATAVTTKAELSEKVVDAREVYFTGGSEQTRKYLYSKISAAEGVLLDDNATATEIGDAYSALVAAIEGFAAMTVSGVCNINGIDSWTDAQVAAMSASGLSASMNTTVKAEGFNKSLKLTLDAEEGEFFNLPGEDGASSPFGLDMNQSGGLRLWVSSDDFDKIDSFELYVGKKTAEVEELLSVYDIPVSAEGYVYIPWEIFYPEGISIDATLDLSGGMNRIGFALNGEKGASLYISGVDAYCEIIEADDRQYYEEKITTVEQIDDSEDGIYKISDPATGKVITWGPMLTETVYKQQASSSRIDWTSSNQSFSLSENNGDDITQQWQVHKMLRNTSNYRLINQGTSAAITYSTMPTLTSNSDLNSNKQNFSVTAEDGKFYFNVYGKYLSVKNNLLCYDSSKYGWELYACKTDEWVQVWGDEFNGNSIDRTKWRVHNSKSRSSGSEPATFRDDPNNIYFEDGNIVFRTVKEDYDGYHATSGYMDTIGLFGITYGKFELRAKINTGKGSWPAFWSMGYKGNWPMNGELDMMEYDIVNESDRYSIYGTDHWFNFLGNLYGSDSSNDYMIHAAKGTTLTNENNEAYGDDYHIFTVEWDETQARTYIDGMLYMSLLLNTDELRWSFGDNPHYLILNVSTKGPGNNQVYSDMAQESFMYVDYVRVYKRASEVADVPTYNDEVLTSTNVVTVNNSWMCEIATSPDGKYLASTDRSNVYLTKQSDNSLIKKLQCGTGELSKVLFSEDSTKLAVLDRAGNVEVHKITENGDGTIEVSKVSSGKVSALYCESAEFSKDGNYIYFGGRITDEGADGIPKSDPSKNLYVMNVSTGKTSVASSPNSNVRNLALSPDGTKLVAACASGDVYVYGVNQYGNLSYLQKFDNHVRCVRGLDWAPDGATFATSDEAGRIFVYDANTLAVKFEVQNVNVSSVTKLSYSPDGTKLLASSAGGDAHLFDAKTGKLISVFGGFSQILSAAEWSQDGSKIMLASRDGYGRIFTSNGTYIKSFMTSKTGEVSISGAVLSGDGTKVFAIKEQPSLNTVCWNIGDTADYSALKTAVANAAKVNPDDYSARSYEVFKEYVNKYKRYLRIESLSQVDVDSAAAYINAAIALKDNKPFGVTPWQTADLTDMYTKGCKATMRQDPGVNALYLFATKKGTCEWRNTVTEGDIKNPFMLDLRDVSGLTFKAYSTKAVTGSTITIGYRGQEEDTLYTCNTGAITTTEGTYKVAFSDFVKVSGDDKLDLSKVEILGFTATGPATTGTYFYDLSTYQNEGTVPVVNGVTEGGVYDSYPSAPTIAWDVGRGELNGIDIENGYAVTVGGQYTLKVINLDKSVEIHFTVNDTAPSIKGDLDGDNEITISDALICLRIAAKIITTTKDCDMDGDKYITVTDALYLLRYSIGLIK